MSKRPRIEQSEHNRLLEEAKAAAQHAGSVLATAVGDARRAAEPFEQAALTAAEVYALARARCDELKIPRFVAVFASESGLHYRINVRGGAASGKPATYTVSPALENLVVETDVRE
jgi:hypothetical protein